MSVDLQEDARDYTRNQGTTPADYRFTHIKFQVIPEKVENPKPGDPVYRDVEYALITPPGADGIVSKSQVKKRLDKPHNLQYVKMNFKAQYEAWKKGEEAPVIGTDIRNWPLLSPAEIGNLKAKGIHTVEELANMPEEAMRGIGMGAQSYKNMAQTFLETAHDTGKIANDLEKLKHLVGEMKESIDEKNSLLDDKDKVIKELMDKQKPAASKPKTSKSSKR